MRQPNIDILIYWYDHFNELVFNNKLERPGMGFIRSRHTDGYFEHYPGTNRKSYIKISKWLLEDEDNLRGTILHEMIHQYQYDILKRRTNHDAIFCSIARKWERSLGITVR